MDNDRFGEVVRDTKSKVIGRIFGRAVSRDGYLEFRLFLSDGKEFRARTVERATPDETDKFLAAEKARRGRTVTEKPGD